jgi:hypothetical protein
MVDEAIDGSERHGGVGEHASERVNDFDTGGVGI